MRKLMQLDEAVTKFLHSGDTAAFTGTAGSIPIASSYEIIRQGVGNLTFASAGTGAPCLDLLAGEGLVTRAQIAFTMIVSLSLKRAYEKGIPVKLEIEDYSNLAMASRFFASALRLPFIPINTLKGSSMDTSRGWMGEKKMKRVASPFDGSEVLVLPPCTPDVAFAHCHWADEDGNIKRIGPSGSDYWTVRAAKHIVVTVEKVLDKKRFSLAPGTTFIPGFLVDAVVEAPFGAHPYGLDGMYETDRPFRDEHRRRNSSYESYKAWSHEWIHDVSSHRGYLKKLGKKRLMPLVINKKLARGLKL